MHMTAVCQEGRTESLFAAIGVFLDAHGLSPDPEHYSFAHAALTDPDMAAAVARLSEGGVRLGRKAIEALGGTVKPREDGAQGQDRRTADLMAQTQAHVDGFADLVREFRAETSDFGRDLAASAAAIQRQPSLAGLDEIARITGAMSARVRDAEARLASATAETDALRSALAQAQGEARRDTLTGLPNRLAFEEAFAASEPAVDATCLAVLDIDHFKRLNDRHGHCVGDRVLSAIARGLTDALQGHVVARHGGEEFAALLTGLPLDAAAALLDEARAQLAERRFRDRETGAALGCVTLSAGVVVVAEGESIDAAFARADSLLYAAKARGRDRVLAG